MVIGVDHDLHESGERGEQRFTLFQYWDTPTPPPEVAAWMAHMGANNPEFTHEVFDEHRARAFIAAHYGSRELRAFDACAVPAMQADYFRLCALESSGGLYVDADVHSLKPVARLAARTPGGFVYTFLGSVNNAIAFFPNAHSPFLRACLALATDNIEARRFNAVFTTTGPGVFDAVRAVWAPETFEATIASLESKCGSGARSFGVSPEQVLSWGLREILDIARATIELTPELEASIRGMTLLDSFTQLAPWFGNAQPEYKQTARHWLHWPGSIYR
jgi:hypothetical protein